MIIDSHSHLNFSAYKEDLDKVVKRAQEQGVVCIDVGTKYETSKRAIEIAEKNENVFAAIGMHPIHIKTDFFKVKMDPEEGAFVSLTEDFEEERYIELAESSKKVVAIGEIGLDYYYKPKTKTKKELFKQKQKEIFLQQLILAQKLSLPIILHCRMAHEDMIEMLKKYPNIKGVIHCFTGTLEQAKEYVDMGFYIGLNGIIFKLNLDQVIKNISLENILLETDCPYLTPPQEGDKKNEPIFVKYVAERIAEIKETSFDKVAEITTKNAKDLFKI